MPSRCSTPCSIRMRISSSVECRHSCACARARWIETAISPSGPPSPEGNDNTSVAIILPAELRIQRLQFGVIRNTAMKLAPPRHTIAEHFGKRLQAFIVERGRLSPVSYQWVGFHFVPLRPEPEQGPP